MTTLLTWNRFESREQLAESFAKEVAERLSATIREKGQASVALSGGSTPRHFLECLGKRDMDWKNTTVTLVDERWVGPDHERANARLLAETLFQSDASQSQFIPLYEDGSAPEDAVQAVASRLDKAGVFPLDIAVLGMGADGHTASLFPTENILDATLDPDSRDMLAVSRPSSQPEARMTMTLAAILSAGQIYLHIEGDDKRSVLDQALAGSDQSAMPIRVILHQETTPVTVIFAP